MYTFFYSDHMAWTLLIFQWIDRARSFTTAARFTRGHTIYSTHVRTVHLRDWIVTQFRRLVYLETRDLITLVCDLPAIKMAQN